MHPAAQVLPDLTGQTLLEAIATLLAYDFEFKSTTEGGYRTFKHPDGSIVHIRSNGEIVRTSPKLKGIDGKRYRRRYDRYGNQIEFILGSNTHNTGEFLIIRTYDIVTYLCL